jgi:membrane fusion protein (multidrug efflux system)
MNMRAISVLLLTALGAVACFSGPKIPTPPPVTVNTMTVKRQDVPAVFEFVGVAQSSHLVDIRSRVEGYLDSIEYLEGSFVKTGQLLFQIDPKPFQASLMQAKAELAKQEAILWDAQRELDRFVPLYEQKAASRRDVDNATARVLAAEASIEASTANVIQAELNLGYTTITSPVSGLSSQANFRQGSLITPAGNQGLLTTVSVIDPIWVNFSVADGDILKYRNQALNKIIVFPKDHNFEIEVVLSDGTSLPSKGAIDFTDPTLSSTTGTMNVRAVIANPNGVLRPSQFVRVKVKGATWPNAIIVPQKAVQQGRKGQYVFAVKEGKAVAKLVQTGDWVGDNWLILSGLDVGDEIIVDGVNRVQDGSPVTVKPPANETQ